MADRKQLRIADQPDISDDDPFAELTRIMGFDPREPASRQQVADADEDDVFDIDLEKELMGDFDAFSDVAANDSAVPAHYLDAPAEPTAGRVFPAQEALAGGLVSKVVPPDQLIPTARELARSFIDKTAPVSIALIRQQMWRLMGADDPMEAHKVDSRGIYARGRSDDVKEGVMSFLEKRPAQFKNKVSTDMPSYYPWWTEREYK